MHGPGVKDCSDRNRTQNWAQRDFLAYVTKGLGSLCPLGHVQGLEPSLELPVPPSARLLSGSLHFGKVLLWGQKGGHQESWRLIPAPGESTYIPAWQGSPVLPITVGGRREEIAYG